MEQRKRKKIRARRPRISRLRRKLLVASAFAVVLLLALLVNLYYVSIVKGPEYAKMAQRQWQSSLSLKAERGKILDRNSNVLAESYTTYMVCVNPQAITEDADRERIANILSTLLNVNYETIIAKMTKINPKDGKYYQQVKIKDQVESNVIAQLVTFQENRAISYYADVKRNYPEGNCSASSLASPTWTGTARPAWSSPTTPSSPAWTASRWRRPTGTATRSPAAKAPTSRPSAAPRSK